MLFNSMEFGVFLPIVFLLYWFVFGRNLKLQNLFIVAVSYLFYGWWDVRFLFLIALTTLVSFISGRLIAYFRKKDSGKADRWFNNRAWLVSVGNIIFNLGILGYFKYYDFFVTSFVEASHLLGISLQVRTLGLVLPVGISFYTFQALSYTIDVYKGKMEATNDIVSFFAYVSFFPQLVAGAIERATQLLPQFYKERIFSYPAAVDGLRQILWGLFKKVVVADSCAAFVDQIYADYITKPSLSLILAAVCFSIQIYCDFSGYSDIAIGTARLFGIRLMKNFNVPYFSRDIAEFWRRWHISLTTWFRDYVYIPLGGSRGNRWQSVRNTLIIFTLSGFWHGANLTFLFWGFFNGLLFLPLLLGKKNRRHIDMPGEGKVLPSPGEAVSIFWTFILVTVGWIFFRSETITQAFDYLSKICSFSSVADWSLALIPKKIYFFILVLFLCEWFQRDKDHVLQIDMFPRWGRYMVYYSIVMALFFLTKLEDVPFIYFQF